MKSEMVEKEFANYAEKISSIFKDVEDVSTSLFANEYIQDTLAEDHGFDAAKKSEFYNKISNLSIGILNTKKAISLINIFGKNGVQYRSQAYTTDLFFDYETCRKYLDDNDIKGISIWYGSEFINIFNSRRYNIMHIKVIRNIKSLDELGILILSIDETYLRSIYGSSGQTSFIVDDHGKILSHVKDNEINNNISTEGYFGKIVKSKNTEGSFLYQTKTNRFLISYSRIKGFNWYLVNFIDYWSILKESSKIRNYTLLIITLCLLISISLAFIITRNLTKSLHRLKRLMNKVEEGDLDIRFIKINNDEINILGENFNKMLENIKDYIKEIKYQERLKKNSELKLLQAQINPHMLYNTLDSMQCNIEAGDIERIGEITGALSTFFKISLSKGDMIIPVWQELEHVKSYIEIQRICSGRNITLKTELSEQVMKYGIIKLTFQPIVENSIIHGFKNYQDNGIISVKVQDSPEGSSLNIIIEDNGMGMLQEEVEKINMYFKTDLIEDMNKPFGVKNVNDRIRHFFGEEYGLGIESEFGSYTRVNIKIPKITI
ncbi:MAG: HAMP domain-containing protein [Ruminiclostridium sp.]|nr:HAMP domain-containing protein [Ruminiclostridium sp.]